MKSTKQETIEQASEYHAHNYFDMHETNNYKALKQGFEAGAKWQQEQYKKKFSEAIDIFEYILEYDDGVGIALGYNSRVMIERFINQFKNK